MSLNTDGKLAIFWIITTTLNSLIVINAKNWHSAIFQGLHLPALNQVCTLAFTFYLFHKSLWKLSCCWSFYVLVNHSLPHRHRLKGVAINKGVVWTKNIWNKDKVKFWMYCYLCLADKSSLLFIWFLLSCATPQSIVNHLFFLCFVFTLRFEKC